MSEYSECSLYCGQSKWDRYVLFGAKTSYKIYSSLKKLDQSEGDELKHAESMAYKNVNKRMHKLHDASLIEEVKISGGYTHGERNYRLTSRGLVYLFSNGIPYFKYMREKDKSSTYALEEYYDSALFKMFIDPYFENSTLLHPSRNLAFFLTRYIQEICKNIRFYLGHERVGFYFGDEDEGIEIDSDIGHEDTDLGPPFPEGFPPVQELNISLNSCIRSFFFKITIMKAEFIDWDWWQYGQYEDENVYHPTNVRTYIQPITLT